MCLSLYSYVPKWGMILIWIHFSKQFWKNQDKSEKAVKSDEWPPKILAYEKFFSIMLIYSMLSHSVITKYGHLLK